MRDIIKEDSVIESSKFKVGDIVRGNDFAQKYGVTKEGYVGRVNEIVSYSQIRLDTYLVDAECFDLEKEHLSAMR